MGWWRSSEARLLGMEEAPGSNPGQSTIILFLKKNCTPFSSFFQNL